MPFTHLPCAFPMNSVAAVSQALAVRKEQVQATQSEIEEAEKSQRHPFPTELSLWTVDDVCRWLDTLQLGEYKQAFREGKVSGHGDEASSGNGVHSSFLLACRKSTIDDPRKLTIPKTERRNLVRCE